MTVSLSGPMVPAKSGAAKQLVVLLHGYGSDGNDLISLASLWRDQMPGALFVAPNAPDACDINPMGFQWFPLDLDRSISRLSGSESARPIVTNFLQQSWADTGVAAKDTLLVGFSQGAMMALDVGLRLPDALMGVVAFSGGVIAPEAIGPEVAAKPPVCMVHGAEDDVVPVGMSVVGGEALRKLGLDVTVHISPGAGHTIAPDGLEVVRDFIARVNVASG